MISATLFLKQRSVWHPTSAVPAQMVSFAALQQQQLLLVASLSCAAGSLDLKMFPQLSGRTALCAAALLCRYSPSSPLAVAQTRLAPSGNIQPNSWRWQQRQQALYIFTQSSAIMCVRKPTGQQDLHQHRAVAQQGTFGPPDLLQPLQPLLQQRCIDGSSCDMRF